MSSVAVAIICKTPRPGHSKTRLSPPLRPEECAGISDCFIQDISSTIASVAGDGRAHGYAVYTPAGTEAELRALLPDRFGLVLQGDGDLGARLDKGITDLTPAGHLAPLLINSPTPTFPHPLLAPALQP